MEQHPLWENSNLQAEEEKEIDAWDGFLVLENRRGYISPRQGLVRVSGSAIAHTSRKRRRGSDKGSNSRHALTLACVFTAYPITWNRGNPRWSFLRWQPHAWHRLCWGLYCKNTAVIVKEELRQAGFLGLNRIGLGLSKECWADLALKKGIAGNCTVGWEKLIKYGLGK